jgi:cytochrome b involved in lipid metabolism
MAARTSLDEEQRAAAMAVIGDEEGGMVGERVASGATAACAACREKSATSVRKRSEWTACDVVRARESGNAVLVAHGSVYDATEFIERHPSGPAPILRALARDNTEDFDMHSARARGLWEKHRIGRIVRCENHGFGEFTPPESSASCALM